MRISDWSSDVCSSDLLRARDRLHQTGLADDRVISGLGNLAIDRDIAAARFTEVYGNQWLTHITLTEPQRNLLPELVGGLAGSVQRSRQGNRAKMGRASGRESECQDVEISVVAG